MAPNSVPKNCAKSAAVRVVDAHAAIAYREMTRLWQAKEIIQLAAHASPECVGSDDEAPPLKQALECVAEMIQVSIEALCSMEEDLKRGRKSGATEVANHG
jgi:hypothetical protein